MLKPRETLDRQIHQLQDEILLLGSMVEQAMLGAMDALKRHDIQASRRIYKDDELINEKRFALENGILITIATQQPIAHDLRLLAAMLEVITELERIGDYAKGNAKVNTLLKDTIPPNCLRDLEQMCELAISILHRALTAFINVNAKEASQIPHQDDEVDSLYIQVYRSLVRYAINNPTMIDDSNYLMWVAHNLERTADRAINICERTVFIETGELLEFETGDEEGETDFG